MTRNRQLAHHPMQIQQIIRPKSAFQQAVDESAMRMQLQAALPGESILTVTELDAGLFNNTYRVNTTENRYILKVSPHPDEDVFYHEQQLMRREQTLAPQLQTVSALIPEYLAFFSLDGRDAFLQPLVEGRLWQDALSSLDDAENEILWIQLGAFAREIHTYTGLQFGYPAPRNGFDTWSAFISDNVAGLVHDCQRLGVFHPEIKHYQELQSRFASRLDQIDTPALLHGDLWPRNVIIEGTGEDIHIKAVFDAERAFWGDPLSDWVLILYGVPQAFWQGYGDNLLQSGDPLRIAIYKGMYFIVNILETTRFPEDDTVYREHLSAVNAALESGTDHVIDQA